MTPFHGSDSDRREAIRAADSAGFEVLAESRLGAAVAGSPDAFTELTAASSWPASA